MSNLQSGSIVWINLGSVDKGEVTGHEQGKKRPCVIIKALPFLKLHIIIPLTSIEPTNPYFPKVKILKNSTPLAKDSYALCHQIRTVSEKRTKTEKGETNLIGIMAQNDLDRIYFTLMDLLDPNE